MLCHPDQRESTRASTYGQPPALRSRGDVAAVPQCERVTGLSLYGTAVWARRSKADVM